MFENWQLLISSIEIYKHYGADLIVTYLDSLLTGIYTILKAYEAEGLLMLKPAVRFIKPHDIPYDPNSENEWYNQDTTYNSCLYEFKESAQFILIADWDDVICFPRYFTRLFRCLYQTATRTTRTSLKSFEKLFPFRKEMLWLNEMVCH